MYESNVKYLYEYVTDTTSTDCSGPIPIPGTRRGITFHKVQHCWCGPPISFCRYTKQSLVGEKIPFLDDLDVEERASESGS